MLESNTIPNTFYLTSLTETNDSLNQAFEGNLNF